MAEMDKKKSGGTCSRKGSGSARTSLKISRHRKSNISILCNGNAARVWETGPPVGVDGVCSALVEGKRLGEPDEKACCKLQIEVCVPELVSELEMVTTEWKMMRN